MREKHYRQLQELSSRTYEIYRLHAIEGVKVRVIMEKLGVSRSCVYRALSTFERENPQQAEMMKSQSENVCPEDNKQLLNELAELKKELSKERLRADFYEEMVAYGKEVYGIDLKKAGTK